MYFGLKYNYFSLKLRKQKYREPFNRVLYFSYHK